MGAVVREQEFAGLRWLVVSGEREDAFRALGETARTEVRAVLESLPEGGPLRRWAATGRGRARLDGVLRASEARHPAEVAEARALAVGAGVDTETLLLANLRGDLGGDDGTGCTDLAWRRGRSYVAHNEDGAPVLAGRLMLLTLRIEGEAPVTVEWYPGFLPANTFTATGHGLVWGINHIQAARPAADAAGRHFVARGLQRARTLDEAVAYLRSCPSAGGFAYTIGEAASGRVVVVEAVAGRAAVVEAGAPGGDPLHWHTNHLRHLPPLDVAEEGARGASATRHLGQYEESAARGAALSRLRQPAAEPTTGWFLDALTSAPLPDGVHRTARGADPLMTLCTAVADLTADRITLRSAGGAEQTTRLSSFARGETASARPPGLARTTARGTGR
ncbi:C45 family autoproteolytic acyltransferase/hydolase [Streptomyces cucumeris]|uniref:C45 family autoproteolytic acyltransferase/hydolase n=1 Tax=Streptomyces cucumeris TaxID=2962890 RepID=UPI003D73AA62